MGPGLHRRLRGSRPWRVSPPRLAGRRRPWPHGSVARAPHAPAVHACHGDDRSGLETTPGRRPVTRDVILYRRLLHETRPYWLHRAGLLGHGLPASPMALHTPAPQKIAVHA